MGHAANITRRGLGGNSFFFCPPSGQICPTVRALRRIGRRAAFSLFRVDTALPVFFYLFAGKLAALLYGEIGVLFDSRIGCVSQRRARVLGCGVVAILLRGGAFPQLISAFLLGLRPRLFQCSFRDFPCSIASRHTLGWFFFYLFHGIISVINYSNRISKSLKWLLNSTHKLSL